LRDPTHKNNWVRELLGVGLAPRIEILEEAENPQDLGTMEQEWIAEARRVGIRLTNSTDGGDGGLWGRKHSKETRLKMSRTRAGLSDGQRAEVVRLYRQGMSTRAVAAVVKTGAKVAWRVLKMEGAITRSRGFRNRVEA
jgi:DNA-directed RNA polymerase specialized sigma24 family protein